MVDVICRGDFLLVRLFPRKSLQSLTCARPISIPFSNCRCLSECFSWRPFPRSEFLSRSSILSVCIFPIQFPTKIFPLREGEGVLRRPFCFPTNVCALFGCR